MSIIAGPASHDLAARIAARLDAQLVVSELKIFADGESKVRIGKTAPNCVIVQSTYPPADTHLLQALMLAKKCADDGARDVCAVIPYLAYARQDRPFLEGESVSIALLARLLEASGAKHLITVDIHSPLAMSFFTSIGIQNVSSIPLLAEFAASMNLEKPLAVSPDAGGAQRAKAFASCLGWDVIALEKTRNRTTGEVTVRTELGVNVSGRDAVLVDDMISSGMSIVRAAEVLRKNGAKRVVAMCVHALMLGDAAQKIRAAGISDVVATNSIPNEYAKVDLTEGISNALVSRYSS
ncbi:MAG TPA: ribose-phosphate pyrophosphokinase [Nitrososphaera sp.]